MPKCTVESVLMGRVGRRRIEASFTGGDLVSDGGVLLLRQMDRRLGLTACAATALSDRRRGSSVRHRIHTLLSQRVYGLCCGWEDLIDHTVLRRDLAMQTAVGQVRELASAPTLSRFENAVDTLLACSPYNWPNNILVQARRFCAGAILTILRWV